MQRRLLNFLFFWGLLLVASPALAQTKVCDTLKGTQRATATNVLKAQHPYDCCDGTILECLAEKPVCPLALRLANDVCRRAAKGQTQQDIERELVRRATSAMASKVSIDVSESAPAGDRSAPIEIVAYLCARCPYCAKLTPRLYQSVTQGKLKGKAKLLVRPFPIRSHKHSTVTAKAMVAAARLGHFWPYVLHIYSNFNRFDPETLPERAAKAGLDVDRFRALLADPKVEQFLVAAKKEGVKNHVEATPTLFINRRKYDADSSVTAIEEFVEELLEAR